MLLILKVIICNPTTRSRTETMNSNAEKKRKKRKAITERGLKIDSTIAKLFLCANPIKSVWWQLHFE